MTKSRARKAGPQKASTTKRQTLRKVGAGKAPSRDRRAPSKTVAENAGATYRKTAARFEEFARDTRMPEPVRALAQKSVAQTRELYVHSLEAALESWKRYLVAAGQGAVAIVIDIARRNIDNNFRLAESLAGAKNVAEAMELQTAYWRKQFGAFTAQASDMRGDSIHTDAATRSKPR